MKRTIELIVSPSGESRLTTRGFAGSSCQDASRFLERTLGKLVKEEFTKEFFETTSCVNRQSERA